MAPTPPSKPTGPKDYVGEQLAAMKGGKAKYESPTQLLQRALEMMLADDEAADMAAHRDASRGVQPPGEEAPAPAEGEMPPECLAGECDHPEHQQEDAFPEDI